jgi:uncharacterized phage protein (TIGR01671 family)
MDKIKCITFDKAAQDALPERIKEKMKQDRENARNEDKYSNGASRTIKFRAKRTDNGEWVTGSCFTTPLTAEYDILQGNGAFFDSGLTFRRHVIADENGCVFEVIPETVGQFTGMHDKNGKEIYEGDIIESSGNIRHQILFSEERGCLCQYGVEFIGWINGYVEGGAITQSYINEFGKVVIGNIHDNKDLITIK